MECEFLFAADYASISVENKLSVCGIFDRLTAEALPTVMDPFFVAIGLRCGNEDSGRRSVLRASLVDPEARVLAELTIELSLGPMPSDQLVPLAQKMPPVPISAAGRHELRLDVEGRRSMVHPILVQVAGDGE